MCWAPFTCFTALELILVCVTAIITRVCVILYVRRHWSRELQKKQNGGKARLSLALFKCLWWRVVLTGTLQITEVRMPSSKHRP